MESIAGFYSLFWGLWSFSGSVVFFLFNRCILEVRKPGYRPDLLPNVFFAFYAQYLSDPDCTYSCSNELVRREWYECRYGRLSSVTKYPGLVITDPDRGNVQYWFSVSLITSCLLVASSLLLLVCSPSGSGVVAKRAWLTTSGLALVVHLACAVTFCLDVRLPLHLKVCCDEKYATSYADCDEVFKIWLGSTMVLPLYFSGFVLLWIVLLCFWIHMLLVPKKKFASEGDSKTMIQPLPSEASTDGHKKQSLEMEDRHRRTITSEEGEESISSGDSWIYRHPLPPAPNFEYRIPRASLNRHWDSSELQLHRPADGKGVGAVEFPA